MTTYTKPKDGQQPLVPHCNQLPFSSQYSGPHIGKKGWLLISSCVSTGGWGGRLTLGLRFKNVSTGAWREQDSGIQVRKSQSPSCKTHLHNTRPLPITQQGILPCTKEEEHRGGGGLQGVGGTPGTPRPGHQQGPGGSRGQGQGQG